MDPVRFISNPSTGKMGYAVAKAAEYRGAGVTLVSGPSSLPDPLNVDVIKVQTAAEMAQTVFKHADDNDIIIKTAAVSDYRPTNPAGHKIKKKQDEMHVQLEKTQDILKELGHRKKDQILVGFAAETEDVIESAKHKLEQKGCDLIVANDVSRADVGFDVDRNEVWIVGPTSSEVVHVVPASKLEVADRILERILEVRRA